MSFSDVLQCFCNICLLLSSVPQVEFEEERENWKIQVSQTGQPAVAKLREHPTTNTHCVWISRCNFCPYWTRKILFAWFIFCGFWTLLLSGIEQTQTLWQQRSEHWESSKPLCCDAFSYLTLLLSSMLLLCIDPWLCLSARKSIFSSCFMWFQYSPSPKEPKEKDSFSNTKDLPFTQNCFGSHVCVVKRWGRKHLQVEVGKIYLLHCCGFLCIRDGQCHWELSPLISRIEHTLSSTSANLTYAVKGWHTVPHKSSREVGFSIS